MPDTGFPRADVENDFLRARRRQSLARLAQWLRRGPDDVNLILPFDEVVAALGMRGERRLGLQTIRLDTIVGTLDSGHDFDRRFRPSTGRVRERWDRLAVVPDPDIAAIQQALRTNLPVLPHPFLAAGQRVRMTRGPLTDVEGFFVRANPAKGLLVISIDMLHRSVAVEVDCTFVEAV